MKNVWCAISFAFLLVASIIASPRAAAQPAPTIINKDGHTLAIFSPSPYHFTVYLDRQFLLSDTQDMMVSAYAGSVYHVGTTTYFVIETSSGGSFCPGMFQVAVGRQNRPPRITPSFGTCSDVPSTALIGNNLTLTMPKLNGHGTIVYTVNPAAQVTQRAIAKQLIGPPDHAGMDLAAFLLGKQAATAFSLRASAQVLERVLGPAMYRTISGYQVGGNYVAVGPYAVGSVCLAHLCNTTYTHIVFDHHGDAWVGTTIHGTVRWFGNPPAAVLSAAMAAR
ncbi:MAG TPA: hypothetical protein PK677_08300 [Acidiphilium sp.]|nr:MAG: hypothetical protein B7Z67_02705 [Acidiphilium sp. 21-60-14]OYV89647.1 MAG: hypothetical protein B7Z57_11495 [Acidiphilium sp. 37-60-79]OZB40841.1 MAG: hypothetical protein B7X48_03160 [Acidiphilium sp. 34-60-192]HQT88543.1 hypothetical protein [Acidiphilium sp.]HQU24388.1 hypothetical protein [Acidiphilium sp.]